MLKSETLIRTVAIALRLAAGEPGRELRWQRPDALRHHSYREEFAFMKKLLPILFWCLLGLATADLAVAADQVYTMAHVCRTDPELTITKVTLTKDETLIDIEYKASASRNAGVFPPGHDMAFFITDVSNAKKFNLLDSEGIAIRPNATFLDPGQTVKFRLTFEKIPMKRFHLIEGKLPTETMRTWHFTNIKLQ